MKKILLIVLLFFTISITPCFADNYVILQKYLIDTNYISNHTQEATNAENILSHYRDIISLPKALEVQMNKNPNQPILQLIYAKFLFDNRCNHTNYYENSYKIIKNLKSTAPDLSPYIQYYDLVFNLGFLLNAKKQDNYNISEGVNTLINTINQKANKAGKVNGSLINRYGNCMKFFISWELMRLYFWAINKNLDIQTVEQIFNLMYYTYNSITSSEITENDLNKVVGSDTIYHERPQFNNFSHIHYQIGTVCPKLLQEYKKNFRSKQTTN